MVVVSRYLKLWPNVHWRGGCDVRLTAEPNEWRENLCKIQIQQKVAQGQGNKSSTAWELYNGGDLKAHCSNIFRKEKLYHFRYWTIQFKCKLSRNERQDVDEISSKSRSASVWRCSRCKRHSWWEYCLCKSTDTKILKHLSQTRDLVLESAESFWVCDEQRSQKIRPHKRH